MALNQELLDMLRCPVCVQDGEGQLELAHGCWLVCQEEGCGRKYPIREEIPVMLVAEGDKWVSVAVSDLPVPPPDV
ncbi:MAG: Trm112 family protein [Anaerolineales bacterium]|nr:Trm112 family protein [Anaerolineales bacterium]